MKLKAFSVFDAKAGAYLQPFFERTGGTAVRAFIDAAESEDHAFAKHPEDYSLWYCGEFDQEKGEFGGVTPECLGSAVSLVARQEGE